MGCDLGLVSKKHKKGVIMGDDDFTERVECRVSKNQLKQIKKYVRDNKRLFDNQSHFIRCGIVKLIREYQLKELDKQKRGGKLW